MIKSIKDFDVKNKRILVRCDFNVPLNEDGNISDDFRIRKILPTIQYLIKNKAKTILMGHLDNPDSSVTETTDVVKNRLEKLLKFKIKKTNDCVGDEVLKEVSNLTEGEVLLLENLRFHKEEVDNDDNFAKNLAKLGDIYINEAFSVCHRAHASIVGIPKYLPSGAGFLLIKEIEALSKIINNPIKPLIALIGGKNVKTKVKFINNISVLAHIVIVNGLIKKEILKEKLNFKDDKKIIGPLNDLDSLDLDQKTIKFFSKKILTAKTIIWNGPFGRFEDKKYQKGTLSIAKAIIKSGAFSVVGGGETVEFLNKNKLASKFSHISTGGGAMIDYLSGDKLPGIEALDNAL